VRLLALVALFVVVPIAELAVIIRVGTEIGLLPTVVLLVADSLIGSVLLRSQGRAVWRRFSQVLAGGRVPHREILDGVLVIFGGALLLTPGFLTDVVGLLLLVPPTRAVARRALVRVLGRRVVVGMVASPGRAAPGAYDVEGTASEVPAPSRRPAERPRRLER
jgi:UPF0716 protein FxsA